MAHRPTSRRSATWLVIGVSLVGALAVLGLVGLWPRGEAPDTGRVPHDYVDATVIGVDHGRCADPDGNDPVPCRIATANLTSGPDEGDIIEVQVYSMPVDTPELSTGDKVVLLDTARGPAEHRYRFADHQRQIPLIGLAVAFILVVLLFGRWKGLRALLGLAGGGFLLIAFVIPALLRGQPGLPVALAGATAMAFITLYLAHGFTLSTTIALAGTITALALTALGAFALAILAEISGLTSDATQVLEVTARSLDLRGLLIAGIVVGALGVIDDVAVSQVSTVNALRRANPGLRRGLLYTQALSVGRDHLASTVNTLVLAYAGASLPLLVLLAEGAAPIGPLITSELIAVEIVRILVGSIGLVVAVPITTGLAALVLGPGHDVHVIRDVIEPSAPRDAWVDV